MQQIIFFIQKYKNFLFFLLLEFIAVTLTLNNLNFHKSKFVNSANVITGSLYSKATNFSSYFNLEEENNQLLDENIRLRNQLQKITSGLDSITETQIIDSVLYRQKYINIHARIEKNDYTNEFNFLLINRGKEQGVLPDMAVINSKGIIGITDNVTNNYARVQSILNKNSKVNARLKNSSYFGTLTWDGKDYNTVQLIDIPRQAVLKIGDTIETDGKSTIFPEGILIGTISKMYEGNTVDNKLDVKLFNDMSNLKFVYAVKNLHKLEIRTLENPENE